MLQITSTIAIPDEELKVTFSRASGPGGQNVNKVNSKATLAWIPERSTALPAAVLERFLSKFGTRLTKEGVLLIVSQRYRDQPKNIEDCRQKLREMILSVLRPPKKRKATKPTRGSKERRLAEKKRRSETKAGRRSPSE